MLSKTLETSMKKAMKYENLTKASRFANNYNNISNDEKSLEKEFLMLQKISDYVKEDINTDTDEISDYITENLDFAEQLSHETENTPFRLPFFRSIQSKLSEVYNV